MSQRILGVDIGSYSIKIAEVEQKFRHFELVGFYEQPLVVVEGQPWEAAISAALMKLSEEYNLPKDHIYAALSGQVMAFRQITLPFGDFKKIDTTIEFEMENYVPLPLDELLIDYQILFSSKTQSNILIGYTRTREMVRLMTAFSGADLDPRFVGAEPIEMAHLLKLGMIQPEGAFCLLDMGHEKTNVMIFSGQQLAYARSIMVGGRCLTQAVAEALKIPHSEAEKMKTELGDVGNGSEDMDAMTQQIANAIKGALQSFIIQLRQTLLSYQENQGQAVQAILLCGGTSRLIGMDQYLSSQVRMNVSFADCLDAPFNKLADATWCRPVVPMALCLAYRGVIGVGLKDIQFCRGEFSYKGEMREIGVWAKQVAVMMVISALFILGTFFTSYFTLRGRVKAQQAKIAAITATILPDLPPKSRAKTSTVLSALDGKISEMKDRQKKMEEEVTLSVMEVLKGISSTMPPREQLTMDINELTLVSKRVRLQGDTNSFEAIDLIKNGLSQSPLFKNISTGNVRKGPKGEVKFDMSFDLVDGEEGGESRGT